MPELIVGKTYLCSDGDYRRLNKIEDKLLHYSVPISLERGVWMELSGTRRNQVEWLFRNGEIVELNPVEVIQLEQKEAAHE